jgi:hypothetical protein
MNYHSFQEVMTYAVTGADGWMFYNEDGLSVQAQGSTKAQAAQNLHNAVVAEYERQESQTTSKASGKDTPDSDNQWSDDAASQHRGGATSIEATVSDGEERLDIKDIIQERYNTQRELVGRLEFEFKVIKTDLQDADRELKRIEAAGNAVGGVDKDGREKDNVQPAG